MTKASLTNLILSGELERVAQSSTPRPRTQSPGTAQAVDRIMDELHKANHNGLTQAQEEQMLVHVRNRTVPADIQHLLR